MALGKSEGEYIHMPMTGLIGMSLPKRDGSGSIFIKNVHETITRTPLGNGYEEISTSCTVTYTDNSSKQTYTVTLLEFTYLIGIKNYLEAYREIERTYEEHVASILGKIQSHNRPSSSSE